MVQVKATKVLHLKHPWVIVERKNNKIVDDNNGYGYKNNKIAWKNWHKKRKENKNQGLHKCVHK